VTESRVLVVDDEPEAVQAIQEALFREPYEIIGVTDPREALEILKKVPIDVVVSDEKMPNIEGTELLGIIRREHPSVVRIILTAHASVASTVRAINEGGVFRYLLKPFPARALSDTIREALRAKHQEELKNQVWDSARRQYDALSGYAIAFGDDVRPRRNGADRPPERATPTDISGWERLSEREREIALALIEGKYPKAIAQLLEISVHTVRNHLKTIYRKLGVRSQLELVTRFSGRQPTGV
jgi:DNA-binding NarL/FixJ family response regulator